MALRCNPSEDESCWLGEWCVSLIPFFFCIFGGDGKKESWALINHAFKGEVEVYIDGTSVLRATSLVLREDPASRIRGMHFQTFFGGVCISISSPYISDHLSGINHILIYYTTNLTTLSLCLTYCTLQRTGNKPDWASPKDQRAWFASITGAIVQPEPEAHHTRQNDEL